MNWGKGITLVMVGFMTFIVVLITIIMRNRIDLVSEDYYQKEVVFGEEIAAQNNWNEVADTVHFENDNEFLRLNLPQIDGVESYRLNLKRPDDNKQDLDFNINIQNTRNYLIERSKLKHGVYEYTLSCQKGDKLLLNKGKYYVK